MADERVLEGTALRRAVAEALGRIYYPIASPEYDTDLNTLKDAAAMLFPPYWLRVDVHRSGCDAYIVLGDVTLSYMTVSHTEPATAAWNTVLRWLARKPEVGNE